LTADEVRALRVRGYRPRDYVEANAELREALEQIAGGVFSRGGRDTFAPLVASLLERDEYFVLADFPSYVETQSRVGQAFRDRSLWTRMSILNTARMGRFSSDRAVREYCERIWKIGPVPVELPDEDLLPGLG
jgi:starch phosphorylase